jgi:muskelin
MCEEQPPVKALHFLQTEVASVVDHTSTEEAAHFRSLLTHLLTPGSKTGPSILNGGSRRAGHNHQEGPRKRSRSEETWTSKLDDEEDATTDDHSFQSRYEENLVADLISNIIEDPMEEDLRAGSESPAPPSERFKQRTEVFESLLEFVDEQSKEPEGNLIDRVNKDEEL